MPLKREDAIEECRKRYSLYLQQMQTHRAFAMEAYDSGAYKDAAQYMSLITQDAGAAAGCLHELNMLIRLRGQRERERDAEV